MNLLPLIWRFSCTRYTYDTWRAKTVVGTPGSESKAEIEGTLAMTQLGLARLGWSDQRTKHEAEEYARRERLLLAYVPLSFDVALSLTRNRRLARS